MEKENKQGESLSAETTDPTRRERLIIRAVDGDREAQRILCKELAKSVLARTRLLYPAGNMMDVEDIAQEALIRACGNLRKLKDPKAFNTWLNTIILNEVRRHTRRAAKHADTIHLDEYTGEIEEANEEFLPQELHLKREESWMIKEIIDALPERQREAVVLHYYGELNIVETAEAMNISHAGVSLYLKLARIKIREELENIAERSSGGMARRVAVRPVRR